MSVVGLGACGGEVTDTPQASGVDAGALDSVAVADGTVPSEIVEEDLTALPEDSGDDSELPSGDDAGPEDVSTEDIPSEEDGDTAPPDTSEQDVPPPVPPPAIPTEPEEQGTDALWQITPVPLSDNPMVFAAPLDGETVLCEDPDGLAWRVAPSVLAYPMTNLTGSLSAVAMIDGFPLITTDEGIFVIELETLVIPSPLGELFVDDPIGDLLLVGDGPMAGLWISAESGLWVHQGGILYDVETPEVAVANPAMAFGATVNEEPAMWVGAEDRVVALVPGPGEDVDMAAWVTDLPATELAVDGAGILWVLSGGDLFRRAPGGTWQWRTFDAPVTGLVASGGAGLWFTVGTTIWHHQDGSFGPTEDGFEGTLLGGDPEGRALVTRDDGLWRLVVGDEPLPPPVVPPTWEDDIEPLYEASCGLCHSATGSANLKLFEREHWVEEIDKVLTMVSLGSMPLPPIPLLDPVEIQMIEDWELAGFPE